MRPVPFDALPAQVDLPAIEAEVLALWRDERVFARSLEQTADGPRWVVYEGPPTANGRPGTHHVEARVFKDVFPRYRTMKGHHVPRRGGWDCHGLPVEIAVEKELGLSGKPDVERYGVEEFNARCRESVLRHVDEFERLTERMGYWVDLDDAYRTMDPAYVESVWWSLARLHEQGLLVEDVRVTPWCPRCGTGLSDHEVAQGYLDVDDPSVYVRLPVVDGPLAEDGASLLVWTTTPWTLPSNTAAAVAPDVEYAVVRSPTAPGGGDEVLVVASALLARVLGDDVEVLRTVVGRDLEGTRYRPPFDLVDVAGQLNGDRAFRVLLADFVTTEGGTGLVHEAPAFGADDLELCRAAGLPVVVPVAPDGRFRDDVPEIGGQFFKDADAGLVQRLRDAGLLLRDESYRHSYPHCWRCDTALIYYTRPSWYVRTTARKAELLAAIEATDWHPPSVRHGRYGDWLAHNVDWAVSRDRYWGTPLPVWRCGADAGHLVVVESLADLSRRAGTDLSGLDPHRPFVDDVELACAVDGCDGTARRVPQVIDAWYDSGSMPFAQWGAPHDAQGLARFEADDPAQYICEALDQTRGWFYTLMAVGTLVNGRSPYETVLCLGHIVDADGRKMSKHLGNVLDPFALFDDHGADAVRWLMLVQGSPWGSRRVGPEIVADVVRRVLLTWWNTASFFSTYARAAGFDPTTADVPAPPARPVLDRWVLGELAAVVADVDAALEHFDSAGAGRRLAVFLDDLSNWYVRRSRRRFWSGDVAALTTLRTVLDVVGRLMAPFTPFLADALHQRLVRPVEPDAPVSVHLTRFPDPAETGVGPDAGLGAQVALLRRLVDLGRTARADSGVRTRQPLPRALVAGPGVEDLDDGLRGQLAEELNVREVAPLTDAEELLDVAVRPEYRRVGRRLGPRTRTLAATLEHLDAAALVADLRRDGAVTVEVEGEPVELAADDLVVTETPREGWQVATATGATVALDLTLDAALRREGLVRDVVRLVQDARKTAALDVSDRVELWWSADDAVPTGREVAVALREHEQVLADEVLAVAVTEGEPAAPLVGHHDEDLGLRFALRVAGG